jgi:hypothetical protein
MNDEQKALMEPKHLEAIERLYTEHGVGDTTAHKKAFWWKFMGPHCFSHDPTDEMQVALNEHIYLVDEFPRDFPCC